MLYDLHTKQITINYNVSGAPKKELLKKHCSSSITKRCSGALHDLEDTLAFIPKVLVVGGTREILWKKIKHACLIG